MLCLLPRHIFPALGSKPQDKNAQGQGGTQRNGKNDIRGKSPHRPDFPQSWCLWILKVNSACLLSTPLVSHCSFQATLSKKRTHPLEAWVTETNMKMFAQRPFPHFTRRQEDDSASTGRSSGECARAVYREKKKMWKYKKLTAKSIWHTAAEQ